MGPCLVLLISCWASSIANATTLTLLSGEKVIGDVIEQTEMRIMVDVQGIPKTFFLGELASIDGKPIETPQDQDKPVAVDLVKEEQKPAPYYNDEEDSLIRFMKVRNSSASPADQKVPVPSVIATAPLPVPAPVPGNQPVISPAPAETGKAAVFTPDGGIIVVVDNKVIKFDKDLKVIQEVNLTTIPSTAILSDVKKS